MQPIVIQRRVIRTRSAIRAATPREPDRPLAAAASLPDGNPLRAAGGRLREQSYRALCDRDLPRFRRDRGGAAPQIQVRVALFSFWQGIAFTAFFVQGYGLF